MEIDKSGEVCSFQQETAQLFSHMLAVNTGIGILERIYQDLVKERDNLKARVHVLEVENERLILNNNELVKIVDGLETRLPKDEAVSQIESQKETSIKLPSIAEAPLGSSFNPEVSFGHQITAVCGDSSEQTEFDGCTTETIPTPTASLGELVQGEVEVTTSDRSDSVVAFHCTSDRQVFTQEKQAEQAHCTVTALQETQCKDYPKTFVTGLEQEQHNCTSSKVEKPYQCSDCGHRFTLSGSLKRHIQAHSGKKPFKCELCNAQFTRYHNLKRHKVLHSQDVLFKCDYCARKYQKVEELEKHALTHSENKRFTCQECGRGFTAASSLKTHMRVHSGERPYQCTVCLQTFTQMVGLQKHQRTHHTTLFACQQCKEEFPNQDTLKDHEQSHA